MLKIAIVLVLLTLAFMVVTAQPQIITDYVPPVSADATQTSIPAPPPMVTAIATTGSVYPPNPTFIPFRPAPTIERPDYRATLEAAGWVFP